MPVIDPLAVKQDYAPLVNDDLLTTIGGMENILVLVTITVPSDLTKMSVNLKAPLIINADTRKASQVILEADYPVKYAIYDILQTAKKANGKEGV